MIRLVVALVLVLGCGDDDGVGVDGGPVDAALADGETALDGALPDGSRRDGESLDAPPPDVEVTGLPICAEAEDLAREGDVALFPSVNTLGGIAILESSDARLLFEFALESDQDVQLWARVRAPTHSNNSLSVGLDGLESGEASAWHAPVTPVLRWQAILPMGDGTEWRPQHESWPGSVSAGEHRITMQGLEPHVELDALCLMSNGDVPDPLLPVPPERSERVNAEDFGATGDGTTDDTDALQAAIDATGEGQALFLPAGRYRTTSALSLSRSDVTIEGELGGGGERLSTIHFDHPGGPAFGGGTGGIVAVGSGEQDTTDLLEDVEAFDRAVVVDASTEFAVGDRVAVESDSWGPPNADLEEQGAEQIEFNRWRRHRAIVTGRTEEDGQATLLLDRPFLTQFHTEHASRISLFQPLEGIVIRRLVLEGNEHHLDGSTDDEWTADERARNSDILFIRFRRVADSFVDDVEIFHWRSSAVHFTDAVGMTVSNSHLHDSTDYDGGGRGYGVAGGGQSLVIHSNRFTGVMRHSLAFAYGTFDSFFFNNTIERSEDPHPDMWACIDIHGQDDHSNLIEANTTVRGSLGVVLGGGAESHGNDGPWNVVRGNTFREHGASGILVDDHTHSQIIEDNDMIDCVGSGVWIKYGSDETYVWNNRIDGWYRFGAGMRIVDAVGTQILGNRIDGGETSIAISISVDSREYLVRGNEIGDNEVEHPDTGTVE